MKHGSVAANADVYGPLSIVSPTPGATVSLDVTAGFTFKWTAGENETVNISGTPLIGLYTIIITNDGVLPRTITLNTGFKSIGVVIGTVSKVACMVFISDGTTLHEIARTLLL